jgi:hypothetical protein
MKVRGSKFDQKVKMVLEDMAARHTFSMNEMQRKHSFGSTLRGAVAANNLVSHTSNGLSQWVGGSVTTSTVNAVVERVRNVQNSRATLPRNKVVSSVWKKQVVIIDTNGNRIAVTVGDLKNIEVNTILG